MPRPHRHVPQPSNEAPRPAPIVAEKAAGSPVAKTTAPARREESKTGRVSILRTLTVIAVCAIAAVALLPGHEAWSNVLLFLTVALLGVSFVAIPNCSRDRRPFWQGFAVFGCGYLLMAFVPSFPHQAGLELPTSQLVRLVHAKATASPVDPRDSFQIMRSASGASPERPATVSTDDRPQSLASMVPTSGNIREFMIVGHCLFTLLAALVGSALAGWFYRSDLTSCGHSGA
jgi:hypothetical protein